MEVFDYYTETFTSNVTYGLGKSAKTVQTVTSQINFAQAAGAVMLVWGSITGIKNYRRFKKGNITKSDAVRETARESVGMGLSACLGLLADTAVKTAFLATTTVSVIPFAVGVAVTSTAKITWDRKTKKNIEICDQRNTAKIAIQPLKA